MPVRQVAWNFGPFEGAELATAHYRIYTTTTNRPMQQYLPGFLEAACAQYARLTGLSAPSADSPQPMTVYMLGSRQQWAAMTRQVTGPRSAAYLAIENGGYCHGGVCVFWDMGHFATLSIAAHEGLHQFLHATLRESLPAWSEEGLAVLAEGYHTDWASKTVRFDPTANTLRLSGLREQLVGGRWIPLERLLSTDAGDYVGVERTGPEYYSQLWAMLLFIRSEPAYRDGLQRLLADAAGGTLRQKLRAPAEMGAGRTYNRSVSMPVFRHYIDADLEGFEKRCRQYALGLAHLN